MQFESPSQAVAAAIRAVFERWTALNLTIQHQCGGVSDRARQLLDSTVAMATNPDVRHSEETYIDLFYAMFDSLDTDIEDGSPEQVATHIVRIRDAAARGDLSSAMEAVQQSGTPTSLFGSSIGGSQKYEEEVTDDAPPRENIPHSSRETHVDEDGFTEVRRSRQSRHTP